MPLPPPHHKGRRNRRQDIHPYSIKIDIKVKKLDQLLERIEELADCDVLVSDAQTGLNDYGMNLKFAKKLQHVSKQLDEMAARLNDKAKLVIQKVNTARDHKESIQPVQFIEEITDPKDKCDEAKKTKMKRFKAPTEFKIKTEWLDTSSDSDTEQQQHVTAKKSRTDAEASDNFAGELDGHFVYPKDNENAPELHHFNCETCKKVFRDQNELRNHDCNHKIEFYTCMICFQIFRSMRSFDNHHVSHSKDYKCRNCGKTFTLKSSLINHAQVHTSDRMHCSHPSCTKTFKHRQSHSEHIVWAHRDKKECPCTICHKMFQTPTNMRSHRLRRHGYIEEITPGYPDLRKRTRPKATKPSAAAVKSSKWIRFTYFLLSVILCLSSLRLIQDV